MESWKFVPLCADSAGGWADEAVQTMHRRCASRVDIARRGHVVGIWWKMLAVALQKEHERVLRAKVVACTAPPVHIESVSDDIYSLDVLPGGVF